MVALIVGLDFWRSNTAPGLCEGRVDDLRQARELALLICSSDEAVETFIAHWDVAARDLLMPYGDVVMALSIVLRIKRTMNGTEIDELISDVQARKSTGDRTRAARHTIG